ncbi:MAG: DnaD domain protein, partial [Oscillospiraceae bacterium]
MKLKINWDRNSNVFVLPEIIANKYISITDYIYIKVIIYIFYNKAIADDLKSLETILNITSDNLKDILMFWHNEGLIFLEKTDETKENKTIVTNKLSLTKDEYGDIALNDENVKFLLGEAEKILGRVITYSECNILVSIYKLYGMPADVMLMLI